MVQSLLFLATLVSTSFAAPATTTTNAAYAGGAITDEDVNTFRYWSEYTAAAYCPSQQGKTGKKISCDGYGSCPELEKSDTKVYSTWYQLGSNSATGFVAADSTKQRIVLSLRGSVNLANWVADAKIAPLACPQYGGKGSMCHTGFLGFWEESKKKAMEGINAAQAEHPDWPIIVAGHSLGAAAALFAASDLRENNKNVTLYSFGQPRAGNAQFSEFISKQGNNFRITHGNDMVPKMPPEMMIYKHISPEYYISDGLGNKAKTYQIVEGNSNSWKGNGGTYSSSILAHIQYYSTNMYACVTGNVFFPVGLLGGQGTKRSVDEMRMEPF